MYQISLKEFADHIDKSNKQMVEAFKFAVYVGILRSMPGLIRNSPVDTGQYAASWDVIKDHDSVMVINYAPHASIIEYGARPGFKPPIGPLLAWAKRILQDPVTPNDPTNPNDYSPEVRALAFGTQKKIYELGIEPRHVLENEIPRIVENIKKEVMHGLQNN